MNDLFPIELDDIPKKMNWCAKIEVSINKEVKKLSIINKIKS